MGRYFCVALHLYISICAEVEDRYNQKVPIEYHYLAFRFKLLAIAHRSRRSARHAGESSRRNEAYRSLARLRSTAANGLHAGIRQEGSRGQRRLKKATRRICHSVHTPRRCTDTDTHRASQLRRADRQVRCVYGSSQTVFTLPRTRSPVPLYRRLVTVHRPSEMQVALSRTWPRECDRERASVPLGRSPHVHRSPRLCSLLLTGLSRPRTRCTTIRNRPVIDCARALDRSTAIVHYLFDSCSPRFVLSFFSRNGWGRIAGDESLDGICLGLIRRASKSSWDGWFGLASMGIILFSLNYVLFHSKATYVSQARLLHWTDRVLRGN